MGHEHDFFGAISKTDLEILSYILQATTPGTLHSILSK